MEVQEKTNFSRIANAIEFISLNYKSQPSLEEIAEKVHLSPFHFQRLFTDWAGVSPKQFLQYITLEHAKKMLRLNQTLSEAAYQTGLSSTSRLHDLFIKIEAMTPGEYKNNGASLTIKYSFSDSPFGELLIASTSKGICYIAFIESESRSITNLQAKFPKASFIEHEEENHYNVQKIFENDLSNINQLKLHLRGTDFQIKVWETLLKIPLGRLTTYGTIAKQINLPNASRAVGTAIGNNPIAFLIPCHRIIQSTGVFGGYMWGSHRKTAIIGWEAARFNYEL